MSEHNDFSGQAAAAPLVRLCRASVTRGGAKLLDGVDFSLCAGQRYALLGSNGAGKTTLLRLLRGDIAPDIESGRSAGEVRSYDLPGAGGPQATALGLRQRLALVSGDMQDLYATNEWPITGLDAVITGFYDTPLLYCEPTQAEREAARRSLDELGLAHLAQQRVARMSTGQARSVLLARALACGPDALFLDECLEGLDAPARAAFLAVLDRAAAADPRLAVLFCSHRTGGQGELPKCLTLAVAVQAGRIAASGPLAEVLSQLETAGPEQSAAPETQTGQPAAQAAPGFFTPAALHGDFLARIRRADVVAGDAQLLHGIDWTIRPGEHWAVLGRNGAGKTTLLSLLAGEIWPSALEGPPGGVEYGFMAQGETLDETRRRLGRVGAALDRDYGWDLTVQETVWSGGFGSIGLYAEAGPELRARADGLLEFFGLAKLAGRRIKTLSRGQLRRVMLARALAGNPALLLLDEPMAGLDARARRKARELFSRLAQAGVPLVMVTHHARDLPEEINRVLALADGRIVFRGERLEFEKQQAARPKGTACAEK
ncbi:MAG TPA: ATP-binding cassette domain-containing protein [Humidesulfovibrio sp.]|uniref:ABC transporter ATP-binding protein n=1 Tax=Humidesulfovibrio sp. TaxID=2910988 RepID=UPI002C606DA0|nr:ATP-binding cassette domain-containing protein [Humidesulfovibrio sp.]HWR03321.1 ATP-binding cassette domain-containing protein [Humidesulfovibrio sp.]